MNFRPFFGFLPLCAISQKIGIKYLINQISFTLILNFQNSLLDWHHSGFLRPRCLRDFTQVHFLQAKIRFARSSKQNIWKDLNFLKIFVLGQCQCWSLVEQFKIHLVVTSPKGWFMPNITYQTELRRLKLWSQDLRERWRKFIITKESWAVKTRVVLLFFRINRRENACQLVIAAKKGSELEIIVWNKVVEI